VGPDADPEALADALLEAHPDAEPWETPGELVDAWLDEAGAGDADDALRAAVLAAWEARRP